MEKTPTWSEITAVFIVYLLLHFFRLAADLFQLLDEIISRLAERLPDRGDRGEKFVFLCMFILAAAFSLAEVGIVLWGNLKFGPDNTWPIGAVDFGLFFSVLASSQTGEAMWRPKLLFYPASFAITELIILFISRQLASGSVLIYLYIWSLNFIMAFFPYAIIIGTKLAVESGDNG